MLTRVHGGQNQIKRGFLSKIPDIALSIELDEGTKLYPMGEIEFNETKVRDKEEKEVCEDKETTTTT